jgi:hypothetical protein
MKQRLITAARFLLTAGLALFVVTCTDSPVATPFDVEGPLFDIWDGASDGNEDVFFLAPLASNPRRKRDFGDRPVNPDLTPHARVCTLNAGLSCVTTPGDIIPNADIANLAMTFQGGDGFYRVNWNTKDFPLDVDERYRIGIYLGDLLLAFRDVEPGKGGSCNTGDDFRTF